MIEVKGLTKRYGELTALSDVSFTVEKGQIVGFLGANGAGKTTTMDILCGCIGADQGTAKIAGFDIFEDPIEAKKRLGYLPDEPPLLQEMKVRDYVEYAAKLRQVPRKDQKQRVDEALEKLSITDVQHRLVGNLSKGYKQRVGLAQALVHDPDVLILDEPTEGLDPNQIAHIRELIRELAGKHTILLSSHILSEVQNTCDHIIIIHQGKVVEQGTYEELLDKLHKGKVYDLQIRQGGEALSSSLAGLGQIDDITAVDGDQNHLRFTLKSEGSEEHLDKIAKIVLDGNHGIKSLAPKAHSLEDVFFEITH